MGTCDTTKRKLDAGFGGTDRRRVRSPVEDHL